MQTETSGYNLHVSDRKIPQTKSLGMTRLSSQTSFRSGESWFWSFHTCYPAGSASSRQSFWEPLLSPWLLLWEEASNWPWREAVVQRQEGPEKHLISINKKGTFNSCLSFWCWGRISCIQADVWPWRCCSVGHSQAAWRTWGSPSWCLSFKQKVFKWKERVGRQIKKALTN